MNMNPYLTFDGNCAEAMDFYAEIFGGEVTMQMRTRDSPMAADMPPEAQEQMMHAQVTAGDHVIMGSDALMGPYEPLRGMHIRVGFDDLDKASRVFSRLAKFGEVEMEFAATFWSAGFGLCRDRYGVPWMVDCDKVPDTH